MNQTTFRKMYTPEEIKAIAGGGGAGLEVIEITDVPTTSTSGTLNEAQMAIVNSDTPSCVKFNNEYYYKNDDNHTEGITVYTHTGNTETDGGATIKYFSITLATAAWTLTTQNVSGKLYIHNIRFKGNSGNVTYHFMTDFILPTPTPYTNIYAYINDYYTRNGNHDYRKGLQLAHNSDEPLPSNQLLISAFIKKNSPNYPNITGVVAYLNESGAVSNISNTSISPSSAVEITVIPL